MKSISITETRARLRADRQRIKALFSEVPGADAGWLFLHPCYQVVWLHRWSHYHFISGNRLLARFLWHVNLLLTGADINLLSDLGGGAVLMHPAGFIFHGNAGSNLTAFGSGGVGGGLDRQDIGAGPGLPLLGNDVVIEFGGIVLGPICIGDGVVIKAGKVIHRDMPSHSIQTSPELIMRRQREQAD